MKTCKRALCAAVSLLITMSVNTADARPNAQREMPSGSSTQDNTFDRADPDFRSDSKLQLPSSTRVALALGGGGTRGAAHVGVLKVLTAAGVPIDSIAGTSMGAIVGGMYSAGVSIDQLDKLFQTNKMMKAFINEPLSLKIATLPLSSLPRLIGKKSFDGLYSGTKFRKFLDRELPDERSNIEDLNIPFCAVVVSLVDGHSHALTKGDLVAALQASSAVPILRRPVRMNDQLFVDGGVTENVPVDQARIALGANFIIAVDVDERFHRLPVEHFLRFGSVGDRLLTLDLARRDFPSLMKADIVIHPQVDDIGLISTRKEDAVRAMQAGEQAARRALPAIRAALQERGVQLHKPELTAN